MDLIVDPPTKGDITAGIEFIQRAPATSRKILADGAYDGQRFRKEAYARDIEAVVPPPDGAVEKRDIALSLRNEAVRMINALGGDLGSRRLWGKLTGYTERVKVEGAFSRLKRLFGEGVFSDIVTVKAATKPM